MSHCHSDDPTFRPREHRAACAFAASTIAFFAGLVLYLFVMIVEMFG